MQAATGMTHHRTADRAPHPALSALPDTDALLSELGALYPLVAFAGTGSDASPADTWEVPSGPSAPGTAEERRSEMDERIMAGLLWS